MRLTLKWGAAWLALVSAPAAAQGPIDAPGTVTHRPAAAHFPARIGEFQRQSVRQYDPAGEDISASYWLIRGEDRLLVTVYVYPSDRLPVPGSRERRCRAEFDGVGAAIVQNNATARRAGEAAAPSAEGVPADLAHRSAYTMEAEFDGRRQPVRSEAYLYCYVGGRWQVKYRVTSSAGFDTSAEIERLIRTGPWPGRAAPADPAEIARVGTVLPS